MHDSNEKHLCTCMWGCVSYVRALLALCYGEETQMNGVVILVSQRLHALLEGDLNAPHATRRVLAAASDELQKKRGNNMM